MKYLTPNWTKAYKSLAIWLPVVATGGIAIANAALGADLVPVTYIPWVVLVTGFLGRIIKQKGL